MTTIQISTRVDNQIKDMATKIILLEIPNQNS